MKKLTKNEILNNIEILPSDLTAAEEKLFDSVIAKTEKQITKHQINITFRWSDLEIKRAKRIAEKLGMPYQTYIKSVLKQSMDKDEKRYSV